MIKELPINSKIAHCLINNLVQMGVCLINKNLTMEKLEYFQKQRFLEGRNWFYHGREKQNQGRICKTVPESKKGRKNNCALLTEKP